MRTQQLFVKSCPCLLILISTTVFAQNDAPSNENRASMIPSDSTEVVLQRFVNECVAIKPGEQNFSQKFSIGSQSPAKHELAFREAGIAVDFQISKYETTQELYQVVMGRNPSRWKGPRNSVENVRFTDAEQFCQKLSVLLRSKQLIAQNDLVRLPTALEWEYCCRAGSTTRYSFGDSAGGDGENSGTKILNTYAWHTGNAAGNDPAVGILKPNAWGLYDFHGYLSEFVSGSDPSTAEEQGEQRMIRGGSWKDKHPRLSSSAYFLIPDDGADDAIGFRCVISDQPMVKKPSGQ
jgi:formylglycine-generating enzyme required for sulfatase activity